MECDRCRRVKFSTRSFLKPLGLTANALAKAIRVPPNRITTILKDERGITGDTAIRLGTFFKTSAEFWMNLQMTYDLRNAEKALPARVRKSLATLRHWQVARA
jgi:addiction module HigA family antidote